MIQAGNPRRLGAHRDADGVNFALYSSAAEAIEVCLFDSFGQQTQCFYLPANDDGVWHGFLPGCKAGQQYGYRAHGPWAPDAGQRFNPSKLLIDPYARALEGSFQWAGALYDFDHSTTLDSLQPNLTDSAAYVPKSVVCGPANELSAERPCVPWADMIIYESNVRGYTMNHPDIPEHERGKFRGMSNARILEYLKALGITSLELMPVHAMIDEGFLVGRGLKNFWGYNSINFFTPESRYARLDAVHEFREMVDAIHDAGIEVLLDVVYNHTGEGGDRGPTLSFRGIDNLCYYRTEPGEPICYVNDTGCGNTLNVDHPRVQAMVLDSLVYWHKQMGVDGFRFDLAPVLGRSVIGFDPSHDLLRRINEEPALAGAKLIAEPWDPGPGGYQLGQFPSRWAEWNDRYRDSVRRFWRGDKGQLSGLARNLHGSSDIFEAGGKPPQASINFVTSHDGFTLYDLVSYEARHNEANGEENRDGHVHNFSSNHGVEGDTKDEVIYQLRRRQRLNILTTLLLSKGTPMLLAGDEFGNSQGGNNNAYAQDNETGWIDWSGVAEDPGFLEHVQRLIQLRRSLPHTKRKSYPHGHDHNGNGWRDIEWLHPDGGRMQEEQWRNGLAMTLLFPESADSRPDGYKYSSHGLLAVAILLNAKGDSQDFTLPDVEQAGAWKVVFHSADSAPLQGGEFSWKLSSRSIACVFYNVSL
ncbi:MAG: glycogen debranching protein GlgX [Gammaproteobacteria bacterium]|nr:glycogen debranching protein GlgX [Gammaproteobacteria bacterium]